MFEKPVDVEIMFKEIEIIRKKYGIPKGMGFIPDKLEIVLERKGIDKFELTYVEFFNYLPDNVFNWARENTIQFFQQMGITPETITLIENGVKAQTSGDFRVVLFLILELFLQNKYFESKLKLDCDSINKFFQMFSNLWDFYWSYDDKVEKRWNNFITIFNKIMQENPSIPSEINAVIKKYTSKSN